MEGSTIHDGREDFAANIHEHHAAPLVMVRDISFFLHRNTLALMPAQVVHVPFEEGHNVSVNSTTRAAVHRFVSGGMPLRAGLLPFFNLLMAASTSSKK